MQPILIQFGAMRLKAGGKILKHGCLYRLGSIAVACVLSRKRNEVVYSSVHVIGQAGKVSHAAVMR